MKKYQVKIKYRESLRPHIYKLKINKTKDFKIVKYICEEVLYLHSKIFKVEYYSSLSILIYNYVEQSEISIPDFVLSKVIK